MPLISSELSELEDTTRILESILSTTQSTWYTVSDSYDYTTQDPYKILTTSKNTLKDFTTIFPQFGDYIAGKVMLSSEQGSESADGSLEQILLQIGITTTPELLDTNIKKYRILDAKASDTLTYDIVTVGDSINALRIRDSAKGVLLLDTSGQSKISTLPDFHSKSLPRILDTITTTPKNTEIQLDISKRSFILDDKTYSF